MKPQEKEGFPVTDPGGGRSGREQRKAQSRQQILIAASPGSSLFEERG